MTKQTKTMKYFDKEEQELIEAIESASMNTDKKLSSDKQAEIADMLKMAVKNTHAKRKSVNLRIQERDLFNFKVRASQEGMPYQTLMSSVLHKYAVGKLVAA